MALMSQFGTEILHPDCSPACRLRRRNFTFDAAVLPPVVRPGYEFVALAPEVLQRSAPGMPRLFANGVLTYAIDPAQAALEGHFAGHGMAAVTTRDSGPYKPSIKPNEDRVGAVVLPNGIRIGVVADGLGSEMNAHRGAAAVIAIVHAWFTTLNVAQLP